MGTEARIGLWGGSFNPPTLAHKALAEYLLQVTKLDQLRWLICPHNPLKDFATLAPFADRLAMVEQIIANAPKMVADQTEQILGISITVNTLRHMRRTMFPTETLFFIMGADNWQTLHLWGDDYADLFLYASLIVLQRPGYDNLMTCPATQQFKTKQVESPSLLKHTGSWCLMDNPVIPMSATNARVKLARGEKPDEIASTTYDYIQQHRLYR